MNEKLSKIYYSPQGYWKGIAAIIKFAKMMRKNDWYAKPFGKYIFLLQKHIPRPNDVSTPNARHTFFIFHTKLWGVVEAEKYTNTLWPSSMWPAFSKTLNHWPRKTLLKSRALFRTFTNAGLWNGHSFCKCTRGASPSALSPKRWKTQNNIHRTGDCGKI